MAAPKSILVPTDFSEAGDHAAEYAFELAHALEAKVHLFHVYTPPLGPEATDLTMLASGRVQHAATDHFERLVARCAGKVELGERAVLIGDPRALIVETAERLGCDLIVMGTNGRRGFKRMVLGSVAETIVRIAPCPVLVVRPARAQP